MWRGPLTGRS